MKKRELGSSGIFVSEIGLGTMSLPQDLNEASKIVDAAIHGGINFVDTADLYDKGKNEELLGKVIQDKRSEIILATKVGNKLNKNGDGWTWDPSKKHISEGVKQSLKRLNTDYIDLYQLHGGTTEDDVEETIETLEDLKKEGLIRHYGISSIRPTVIQRFLKNSSAVSVMMQYNLLDRRPEEWFHLMKEYGASVITRGTLAKGLLTREGQERVKSVKGFVDYEQADLLTTMQALLNETDDIHAAAIAFALLDNTVASALVGASSSAQLMDSLNAYEFGYSSDKLVDLKNMVAEHQYKEHRIDY